MLRKVTILEKTIFQRNLAVTIAHILLFFLTLHKEN